MSEMISVIVPVYNTAEYLVLLVVFYLIILLPVSILGTVLERRLRYASFGT